MTRRRNKNNRKLRVVFWGTYDLGKPRVRLLLRGARSVGIEVIECHSHVWKGVKDKSQLPGLRTKILYILHLLSAYPSLVWRYFFLPPHDAVIIGYMGHLDVIIIWPFSRLRNVPVIWDAFLSLYDTVVNDRQIVSKSSPMAWLLYFLEFVACRAADKIFLDTKAHACYFEQVFKLPPGTVGRVLVGTETNFFAVSKDKVCVNSKEKHFTVLFYGQFIPLHGIDIIIEAAQKVELAGEIIKWKIIGQGQEAEYIDKFIKDVDVKSIERILWVPYNQLAKLIKESDVCLGIFGTSEKAKRVIPNKIFQILAVNRPLITGHTPAICELFKESPNASSYIHLIPCGDADALASSVLKIKSSQASVSGEHYNSKSFPVIGAIEVGRELQNIITSTIKKG
jgi:glycosyltransferase involved in cell wall biosynthesis